MDLPTSTANPTLGLGISGYQQQPQHPFNIPKILRYILKCTSVEDLKASRLVSHSWHSEATFELTTRIHPIILNDKLDWKKFLKILSKSCTSPKMLKLSHHHPFHSFAFINSYPEDPQATPYKTAILDYMHAKYRLPRKTLWDSRFFSTYGIQILELKFIQFSLYSEKALREFREMLSERCPNLSSLCLQFQKDTTVHGRHGSFHGSSSSASTSTSTPTPSPSPSPQMIPGTENVFFPPNESSQRKTLAQLKHFTFTTDNKVFLNPHAVEEFMALMPSLESFTYRHTGAKKQWTLLGRRLDIVEIFCNIINAGQYPNLIKLDLDSDGTVLSGEDFRKLSKLRQIGCKMDLRKFSCQVFIKNENDWENFCSFLYKISPFLETLDLQVRTNFPQLLSEQELPSFPRVRSAKLLLDSNLKTFLKRMPLVHQFCGVYDNEILNESPPTSAWGTIESRSTSSSSPPAVFTSSSRQELELKNCLESLGISGKTGEIRQKYISVSSISGDFEDYNEPPFCPTAKYLTIQGNDEFGLDVEWKSRVFPNITKFETDIYFDEDLRLIWMYMKHVKSLILHIRANISEQAFTGAGVPRLSLHEMDNDFDENEALEKLNEYPNMSLLNGLERLEIYSGSRQDAYGSKFSASIIIYGVSLLENLKYLVLPPSIPVVCFEDSLRYLSKLNELRYLSVCDDIFQSVLPFHMLKMDLPQLEIVVRYYQPEIKRLCGNFWRLERLVTFYLSMEEGRGTSDIQLLLKYVDRIFGYIHRIFCNHN